MKTLKLWISLAFLFLVPLCEAQTLVGWLNIAQKSGPPPSITNGAQIWVGSTNTIWFVPSEVSIDQFGNLGGVGNITWSGVQSGPVSLASLPNSGATAGVYGDSTHVPQVTVDAKGRITAISNVTISGGGGGGNGLSLAVQITQANSFTLGQSVYYNGSSWVLSQANNLTAGNALVLGVVTSTGNPFTITLYGYTTNLSGLALPANTTYYLSATTAGGYTGVAPTTPGQAVTQIWVTGPGGSVFVAPTPPGSPFIPAPAYFGSGTLNNQSANYTFALSDVNSVVRHVSSDATPRTFTIPAQSVTNFNIGSAIMIWNQAGAGTITLNINTDTLTESGGVGVITSTTIPASHSAAIWKDANNSWVLTTN